MAFNGCTLWKLRSAQNALDMAVHLKELKRLTQTTYFNPVGLVRGGDRVRVGGWSFY